MGRDYLSVGEMSKLFDLNKQTLQYYDRIGLFSPACRDENGYRQYRFEQCYKLAAICNMRGMGYSIQVVSGLMESMDTGQSILEMKKQYETVQREQERLNNLQKTLERKISFVEQENKPEHFDKVFEIEYPERYYYPIGGEELLYRDESFYLNPTLVIYHGKIRKFGAYLFRQEEMNQKVDFIGELAMDSLGGGKYFCGYHFGPYENICARVEELRKIGAHLPLGDWSVHFNIIDQFMERDAQKFVTQIQIPIEQEGL